MSGAIGRGLRVLSLDHLVVTAASPEQAARHVARTLGVAPDPGGRHPEMATANRLLHLGPSLYLEAIGIDRAAPAPARTRWFGLDRPLHGPRLAAWVARCDDLEAALARAPDEAGEVHRFSRGTLRWSMAVAGTGVTAFEGLFPWLITWQGPAHPATQLPDRDCRLTALEVAHPQAERLAAALIGLLDDPRVAIVPGPVPALSARIMTPGGMRVLS